MKNELDLIKEELKKLKKFSKEELLSITEVLTIENYKKGRQILNLKAQQAAFGNMMTHAAVDLLLYPGPEKIHFTENQKGFDCMIEVMNVLCVESKGRDKYLHLKSPVRPINGGVLKSKLAMSLEKLNWETALYKIQKRNIHLIKVSNSHAVNIQYYNLAKKNHFVLQIDPPKEFPEEFIKLEIDKTFDIGLYHSRLFEFATINRYKKS